MVYIVLSVGCYDMQDYPWPAPGVASLTW